MKITTLGSIIALAMLGTAPLAAQPAPPGAYGNPGWDRDAFWRGAPDSPRERIDVLQHRIDRGISDGSLDRREARDAQFELSNIRRDAARLRGDWRPEDRDMVQRRLDDLARRIHWARTNGNYGYAPPPPPPPPGGYDRQFATDYDASRYYRDDPRYQERNLSSSDQVYRGSDGRYYCKRNDGTTGLIIGAVGGGVLGNIIDGGHNRAAGTLIGGALGALAGKSIDQNSNVRCR